MTATMRRRLIAALGVTVVALGAAARPVMAGERGTPVERVVARGFDAGMAVLLADGPLTPLVNVRGRTEATGYLRVSLGATSGSDGPLTPLGQLRGRTDANGYLRVSVASSDAAVLFSASPFITVTGPTSFLASPGGGGGGGVFENTTVGYAAGAGLTGTAYANTLMGHNAGKALTGTAPNATSNVMIGYGAGEGVTSGAFHTLVGTATGSALTTQSGLTLVGYHAGVNATGTGNSFVGNLTGRGAAGTASGISNTAVGDGALTAYTAADSNAAFGISTLESLTSGDNNTAIGSFSLRTGTTTASGSIGLGYFAGAYETGSNKFFVNNQNRTNESGDRTLSLLYGVMAAAAANQSLTVNGAVLPTLAQVTAGSATGLTVSNTGEVRTTVYKVVVDRTAFVAAATTADLTIGTLPANTWLVNVTASLTTTFACTATCTTATLSMVVGKGAGGAEYLASFDADAATAVFGDADAEMGTLMTRAAAIQGGTFTAGSQAVVVRLTSGTGNIGDGAATNLSQGSITIWVTTRTLP